MESNILIKKVGAVALLVVIFVAGFSAGNAVKYYLDMWRADRNVGMLGVMLEAPFKNDKYGGKTPEETFDMYLSALKKGDLELASKYYWLTNQKDKLEILNKMKEGGELDDYVRELENGKRSWKQIVDEFFNGIDRIAMEYDYVLEKDTVVEIPDFVNSGKTIQSLIKAGVYKHLIRFEKNYNIWKLMI